MDNIKVYLSGEDESLTLDEFGIVLALFEKQMADYVLIDLPDGNRTEIGTLE